MYLAENGIKIKVWGWSKDSKRGKINHPNILNMDRYAYGDEFAKVMCASAVCLNFLRKANRDTETTRSIEIPACGAFMLAERTKQHQEMFTEGTEAIYFESKEELLEKVKYYLTHKEIRIQIALAGYRRCLLEDYSYENQLKLILREVA
jgi:spore maturation protein CgeB